MDATYLQRFLSDSARSATRSEIRELLKLVARPEVISLAGGMPPPESFPLEELAELVPDVLRRDGSQALQYGPTEGDSGLRHQLLELMTLDGIGDRGIDRVLVTSASQQGLDLCARVFLAPGDAVVCGLPSYLGALGAFNACGARLSGIPLDDRGMRTDLLEQRLLELRREGVQPKLVYVVPDFQNPAGVCLDLQRRVELLRIAGEFDLLVLEDSPYRALRYEGESLPSLASLDTDGRVISLFTFSKILFPGLRLGWITADPQIVSRLTVAKQAMDLCTAGLSQFVAREYLAAGRLPAQLERLRRLYLPRRAAMLHALQREIRPEWGVRWTHPEGGLFIWLTLPRWLNAAELLEVALQRNVAFVTGSSFHCDGSGHNTLRLNFSYPDLEQIDVAVGRLARAIGEAIESNPLIAPPPRTRRNPELLAAQGQSLAQLSWNLALSETVE